MSTLATTFLVNNPLEQFEINDFVFILAPIFGFTKLSLTNIGFYLILVVTITIGMNVLSRNNGYVIPSRWAIHSESVYGSILNMVREQVGAANEIYVPFIFTLFNFVLISNLVGLVPYSFTTTSHLVLTLSLSTAILIGVTIIGFQRHGLGFFAFFIPAGTPFGLVFLLVAIEFIVRHCASICFGNKVSMHWSVMHTATELGQGENPRLNLASPINGEIRSTQNDRVVPLAVSSMVKAILLKVYSPGASLNGLQLVCNRLYKVNSILEIKGRVMTYLQPDHTNVLKVEKGQPKDDNGQIVRTMGSPKATNGYGDRGTVVLANPLPGLYCSMKLEARGRVPGCIIRSYVSAAGDSSTVQSNATKKLLKLAEFCRNNPQKQVDSKVYNLLYDIRLFEMAYHKLKSKPGNMTPGFTPTTLDGMSPEVIEKIVESLKNESFQFSPGRRVIIPKANGGQRPLTVAPPRDKLVQEVIRMILEAIFEPTFSESSHGFRAGKSCHSALKDILKKFGVASWYIEGDISKCFDSIDHEKLMSIVELKIADRKFTRLIRKALKAGYFEFKQYKHSIVGTPQGSIISPILCNIYMDKLDKYVEYLKMEFDRGNKAKPNPTWSAFRYQKTKTSDPTMKQHYQKMIMSVPSKDLMDLNFKKLIYVRYADDWIIGVRGSKNDCVDILKKVSNFLNSELSLKLSTEKTLITNARDEKALFLGTRIFRSHHQGFVEKYGFTQRVGQEVRLEAPLDRISKKLTEAGFLNDGLATPRFLWLANDKDTILALYNSVYRGIINYYSFAMNLGRVTSWVHFILKSSCAKLLAAKFKLKSQSKVYKRFGKNMKGNDKIGFADPVYSIKPWNFKTSEVDIIKTLYAESLSASSIQGLVCSICGSSYRVEMHHVKHLKDLNPKMNHLDALMAKKQRKQIAVCRSCHLNYHSNNKSCKHTKFN
ncbi:hypothetical protein INT45_007205 [Circinella minor]|uniref:Reverse transcriptase domain-containing protein n=1 Tax=Circinella minor TaxID=1195481 RepID=A0A8H7RTX8_9FUNG|nr:hypothetical protein INT45_007205 [Circinella minor]